MKSFVKVIQNAINDQGRGDNFKVLNGIFYSHLRSAGVHGNCCAIHIMPINKDRWRNLLTELSVSGIYSCQLYVSKDNVLSLQLNGTTLFEIDADKESINVKSLTTEDFANLILERYRSAMHRRYSSRNSSLYEIAESLIAFCIALENLHLNGANSDSSNFDHEDSEKIIAMIRDYNAQKEAAILEISDRFRVDMKNLLKK